MAFRTQTVVWTVNLMFILALRVTNEETIIVDRNGQDNSTCLPAGEPAQHPCRTLEYVLRKVPTLLATSSNNFTVEVNYSQEPESSLEVFYAGNLTLVISGMKSPTIINCTNGESIAIRSESAITLVWERITFQGCGLLFYANSSGFSLSMHYCHINNCKNVHFFNVQEATINECLFSNNTVQPTEAEILQVDVSTPNIMIPFHYHVKDTRFERNAAGYSKDTIDFLVSRGQAAQLTILFDNCTFRNNQQETPNSGLVGVFIVHESFVPKLQVSFRDCLFLENNLSSHINIQLSDDSVIHDGNFEISNNNFSGNDIAWCDSSPCSIILVRSDKMNDSSLQFYYDNNLFDQNNGIVLSVHANHSNHTINDCNFTDNSVGSALIDLSCTSTAPQSCNFYLKDLTVTGNYISKFDPKSLQAIINVNYALITVINGKFTQNEGSVLNLTETSIHFTGYVLFSYNIGTYGGAIRAFHSYVPYAAMDSVSSSVTFSHNTARYGGAIYNYLKCFFYDCNTFVVFENNSAGLGGLIGSSIYSIGNHCSCDCPVYKQKGVSSPPVNISFPNLISNHAPIAPGQEIVLSVNVTDCFGSPSACTADAYLLCNDSKLLCQDKAGNTIQLVGPPEVFLISGTVHTGLHIEQTNASIAELSPELFFQCQEGNYSTSVPLTVVYCPSGFWFNKTASKCECVPDSLPNFNCSEAQMQACIQTGYWYGTDVDENHVVTACQYPFCNYSRESCPSELSSGDSGFLLLGETLSEQCSSGHDGILCAGCSSIKIPSFGAMQCIAEDKCQWWHPYILLSFAMFIEILFCVFIFVAIRLKLDVGLGYMYGPLFFMAVVSQLPIHDHTILATIVSMYTSMFLQNLEVLGHFPWCFFVLGNSNETVYALPYYSFRFLGPFIIAAVLALVTVLAQKCAKLVNFIQQSPMEPFCLLILLSSWSLADTSVKMLMYVSFGHGYKVALQPDLIYLHGVHIPLWIISTFFLLFFFIPLILLLLCSPFLMQCRWVYKTQPFLDQFQSCYQDKYRWYAAVYFGFWLILQAVQSDLLLFQAIIILVATCHFLLQPYRKKWLNIVDSLLLLDLIFFTVLNFERNSPYIDMTDGTSLKREVAMYLLVVFPFLYIAIGSIVIVTAKIQLARSMWNIFLSFYVCLHKLTAKSRIGVPDQHVEDSGDASEREPLIGIVQNSNP